MTFVIGFFAGIVTTIVVIGVYSCCVISGENSRHEEKLFEEYKNKTEI